MLLILYSTQFHLFIFYILTTLSNDENEDEPAGLKHYGYF